MTSMLPQGEHFEIDDLKCGAKVGTLELVGSRIYLKYI